MHAGVDVQVAIQWPRPQQCRDEVQLQSSPRSSRGGLPASEAADEVECRPCHASGGVPCPGAELAALLARFSCAGSTWQTFNLTCCSNVWSGEKAPTEAQKARKESYMSVEEQTAEEHVRAIRGRF